MFGPGGETFTAGQNPYHAKAARHSALPTMAGSDRAYRARRAPRSIHLTPNPARPRSRHGPSRFGDPLLALAAAPGITPGAGNAQAIGVGENGEIARYTPGGVGPRSFSTTARDVQTPTLRASPGRRRARVRGRRQRCDVALALGDRPVGTGPGQALNFHGNLDGVAFSPAIQPRVRGRQAGRAARLRQDLDPADAAGGVARRTSPLSRLQATTRSSPTGCSIRQIPRRRRAGSWSTTARLADRPIGTVAVGDAAGRPDGDQQGRGLPDGGAVAAGPGVVLERDSAASPWRFSTTPLADSDNGNSRR